MNDQALVCARCHEEFLWTAEHQATNPEAPDTCYSCRKTLYDLAKTAPVVPAAPMTETYQGRKAREARERRARRAAQLADIKKALRTPVAKILEMAKEAARTVKLENAEYKRSMDMNRGRYMEDAPSGMGELITGGYGSEKLELVGAMRGKAEALGSATEDEDGNAIWPDNDRRVVAPEGTGDSSYEEGDDEGDDAKKVAPDAEDVGAEDEVNDAKFIVKLSDYDEAKFSRELFDKYFVEDGNRYVCRLCLAELAWESEGRRHMESAHGLQSEPEHQHKYGNVVKKELRLFKRGKM